MDDKVPCDKKFLKRRDQKNKIVLALVAGLVVVIFAVTIVKMQLGGS